MDFRGKNYWALILGGSSGFGLASAKKLSRCGMNICIVHRDRRGAMARIESEFQEIQSTGVSFKAFNLDALSAEGRSTVLQELHTAMGQGKIRLLLHSIAFGNLKLLAPRKEPSSVPVGPLAAKLGIDAEQLQQAVDDLFRDGEAAFHSASTPARYDSSFLLQDDELADTIYAMGTSLLSWTRDVFAQQLFAPDARVLGLTSEGNEIAWLGYAGVSAAKVALESISRSIAREFAPFGIRCNIVQPGVTDTPALRLIPGSTQLVAKAALRNPFGRITQVEDVAGVVALLASDEAAWINGSILRVDGGEAISG